MKKLLCVFLAAVMLLGCASFALAADDEAAKAADTLHSLGLFRGRGEDENGRPIYDLESPSTRAEALVMLIRLLGKEEEALAQRLRTPLRTSCPGRIATWPTPMKRGLPTA